MTLQRVTIICTLALLTANCGGGSGKGASTAPPPGAPPPPPPVGSPPPPDPGRFVDTTPSTGLAFTAGLSVDPVPEDVERVVPSSVAAGDYDNDGDVDLFIVRGDVGPNLLYRNDGNLAFTDVAVSAGVANTASASDNFAHSAVMFADIDGDADLDLFVGGLDYDPTFIFANNGDGTFSDVTVGSGLENLRSGHSVSAAFGDYDLDGDLDLFVARWGSQLNFQDPGDTEHLWRNDTDATGIRFTSVSEAAGIAPSINELDDPLARKNQPWDFTFAPSFARIDDDLYPDLTVVADFNWTQYFRNNRDGTFTNATDVAVLIDGNGMGSALGDYDNDGDLDWFVSSILCHQDADCGGGNWSRIGNRLYRNAGGVFEDATDAAGVASGGWGWGACFVDFDNDGDLDIYHTNGWPRDDQYNQYSTDTSRLFVSDGAGGFVDMAADYGLADTAEGRGVVCADFDDDGDIDILQLRRLGNPAVALWRNDNVDNRFLKVRLRGRPPNTQAAGARITIDIGGSTQMREISIASNFVSQNPAVQHFGLGTAAIVDEVRVEWPDGRQTVLTGVAADQLIEILDQ